MSRNIIEKSKCPFFKVFFHWLLDVMLQPNPHLFILSWVISRTVSITRAAHAWPIGEDASALPFCAWQGLAVTLLRGNFLQLWLRKMNTACTFPSPLITLSIYCMQALSQNAGQRHEQAKVLRASKLLISWTDIHPEHGANVRGQEDLGPDDRNVDQRLQPQHDWCSLLRCWPVHCKMLAAFLSSTHYMPVSPCLVKPKMSLDISNVPLQVKSSLVETHWCKHEGH